MAMVCPQCGAAHEQRLQCPACDVRLVYRVTRGGVIGPAGATVRWHSTPWGRIFIGLLLSQGLYYGLEHLLVALLMSLSNKGLLQLTWTSTYGLLFLQGIQVVALIFGGMLAGGGVRHGVALGAIVGVWNGVLAVLIEPVLHPDFVPGLTAIALVGQPLLHVCVGALGGWIGQTIWQPPAEALAHPNAQTGRKAGAVRRRAPLFAGRVAWFRVAVGIAVVVVGYLSAGAVFNFLLDFGAGKLSTESIWQDRVIIGEIQAIAVLLGSSAAGYNTANGLKQGLFVGAGAGTILMAALLSANRVTPEFAAVTVVAAFILSLVGGWFGSQLFPPVVRYKSTRGIGPASLA
jgi:hypothetical protein